MLATFFGPRPAKRPPRRFKILSRRPQDGSKIPKTPQNASKTPQDASKTPQDASKTPPDLHVGRFLIDFWSIFDRFLVDVGWFLVDFWSICCRCFIGLATLLLCYFVTLLLCYFVLGAVAGSQLCCAVYIYIYIYIWLVPRNNLTGMGPNVKGYGFLGSPYGFEVFLKPGEVVNLAGVWLSMISIIFECSSSSNRFWLRIVFVRLRTPERRQQKEYIEHRVKKYEQNLNSNIWNRRG